MGVVAPFLTAPSSFRRFVKARLHVRFLLRESHLGKKDFSHAIGGRVGGVSTRRLASKAPARSAQSKKLSLPSILVDARRA